VATGFPVERLSTELLYFGQRQIGAFPEIPPNAVVVVGTAPLRRNLEKHFSRLYVGKKATVPKRPFDV